MFAGMADADRPLNDSHLIGFFLRRSVQNKQGLTGTGAKNFDLLPRNIPDPGPERLGNRFFRGKPAREGFRFVLVFLQFGRGKDAIQKPIAVKFHRLTQAGDFDQIHTADEFHLPTPTGPRWQ